MACCQYMWMILVREKQGNSKIIIDPFKETFESGKERCSMLKYLGLFRQRNEDCIAVDHNNYFKSLDHLVFS